MFLVLLILSFTALSFALSSTNLILNADYSTSYSVDCSAYSYFQVDFPFPCQDLNITLTAVLGDLEIYVSKKIQFVQKTDLNWGAINQDSLVISHWDPESSPGMYYIAVYNNCKGKQKQGSFKIAVRSSNDTDDHDDIYLHPSLTRNKLIAANGYEYFRFCVPKCADVIVTLENCMDYTTCPFSYSFPEMLLTRTERDPNINDYTYKLASNYRRFIKVNHTDPAALDRNGFLTGSYYVGIFGWCTPDDQVVNWETDGPCSLAANTTFNITVDMTFYPDDKCSSQNWIIPQAESDVIPVNLDTVIHGTVACNDYRYYTVAVTKPCTSLNIWIGNNTINTSVAELAIAKYPNLRPTFDNIAWTSYNFYYQNLTIDLYDPNFDTGYICGPHYNTTCIYYIGVYGYCAADNIPVNYSMIIKTISETTSENIFNQIQRNQQLTPKLIDSTTSTYSYSSHYTFCANNENEINAYFYLWETGCNCMNDYSDLQLVISRTERNATIGDLTWSIDSDEEYHHLVLNSYNDTAFREGTFYVNVWSSCTPNNLCDDICTCSPCSNLPTTKYGLYITNQTNFNYSANVDKFLDTCDNLGTCSSTCSSTSETTSSNDDKLSTSDKVGIALGVFFFVVIVLVVLYSTGYFAYQRFKYSRAEMTNPTGRTMGEREDSFSGIDENALDGVHLTQGRALVTREGIELKV